MALAVGSKAVIGMQPTVAVWQLLDVLVPLYGVVFFRNVPGEHGAAAHVAG